MKTTIIGAILTVLMVINMLTHISISSNDIRAKELENSVTTAVRQTVENIKIKEMYEYNSVDQVIAEFNRILLMNIDSDSTIVVRVLGVNQEEGFLDVEVTSKFSYPNGEQDEVKVRKSIVYEEIPDTE